MTLMLLTLFLAPMLAFAAVTTARSALEASMRRMGDSLPCWLAYSDL